MLLIYDHLVDVSRYDESDNSSRSKRGGHPSSVSCRSSSSSNSNDSSSDEDEEPATKKIKLELPDPVEEDAKKVKPE